MILQRCNRAKLRDGTVVPLNQKLISQIEAAINSIGNRALRCIGLAFKDNEDLDPLLLQDSGQYDSYLKDTSKFETIENDMIFVGLVAIRDPPRPKVSESGEISTYVLLLSTVNYHSYLYLLS